MKFFKCEFEKDTTGFYITPLIGFSNVKGDRSIWFGWLAWLFTIKLDQVKTYTKKTKKMTGIGPWACALAEAFGLDPRLNHEITLEVSPYAAVTVIAKSYVDEYNTDIIDIVKKVSWVEDLNE